MLAASFTFLTPLAGVLALLAVVPLLALVAAARRVEQTRRLLHLPPPPPGRQRRREAAVAGVVVLLALASMQPVIRTQTNSKARKDAQLLVVLDTSRSMAAAPSPTGPSRLARAKRIALALGAQVGDVPAGVATFTDRVLPDLFPTADRAAFDSVVSSVTVEDPPPRDVNPVATTFDALGALGTQGFFPDSVHKRAVVVITDGESGAYDPNGVASALADHGVRLKVVRVGTSADRVWSPDGRPEAAYRPDPAGARVAVSRLDNALGNRTSGSVAAFVRKAVGVGPTATIGTEPRTITLAPVPAVLALILVLFIFRQPRAKPRYRFGAGRTSERVSG